MNTTTVNKNFSTSQGIAALALSNRQRAKAMANLALVNALLSACFALCKRLTTRQSSSVVCPLLKAQ
jgi:hypothetical protein